MDTTECLMRLKASSFGVLGTVDRDRGTHLIPVVFVVRGDALVIPIDTVKPKTTTRLRRVDNLRQDPRASLLVDHRDADWATLWWVRADVEFKGTDDSPASWSSALAAKYPQYDSLDSIDSLLLFTIRSMRGWTAAARNG
jgi:PPOX class probable F420-dependent enzyme